MSDVLNRLALAALAPGSLLRTPPDWEGNPGMSPGVSGVPTPMLWDAFATATAAGLTGNDIHFAVDAEWEIVVRDRTDPEALHPLIDALAEEIEPPLIAVAVREAGDIWAAAANRAKVIDLPDARGDEIEVSSVDRVVTTRADGADSDFRYPALEELLREEGGNASLVAHRFTGSTWVIELFPL